VKTERKIMKKNIILLVIFGSSLLINAQMAPKSVGEINSSSRNLLDNEYQCLPGSVFSQVFPTYNDAYFCDTGSPFTQVTDDYAATAPFSTIRFWGINYYNGIPGSSQTFKVDIYNGIPGSGGTLVSSVTKTITPKPTGVFVPWGGPCEIYMVDFDFGSTITQLNGWLAVSRINPGDTFTYCWMAMDGAGNAMSYYSGIDYWVPASYAPFFCLGGEAGPPPVPVSGWAILIGIGLIAITVVARFRKVL
jgi:hypothetical protein